MRNLTFKIDSDSIEVGNYATAKDVFPTIEINQETGLITITKLSCDSGKYPKSRKGNTVEVEVKVSNGGDQMLITGSTEMKNYKNYKCSGSQNFVFCLFVGDSGHIYVHRAPATKVWLELDPELIRKRLVKLGIGATKGIIQQGDFLLKPANGNAYQKNEFKHETTGAGHHRFEMPVLYATGSKGRQYLIQENTILRHEAVDGIQHPDVTVQPGIYIVGTTANSLRHGNKRD